MSGSGDHVGGVKRRFSDAMKDTAARIYFETLEELNCASQELDAAMQYKCDAKSFQDKLDIWLSTLSNVKYAESEWVKLLSGPELQNTVDNARQTMASYQQVKKRALEYIDDLLHQPELAQPTESLSQQHLFNEVEALRREVSHLTATMSKTAVTPRTEQSESPRSRFRRSESQESLFSTRSDRHSVVSNPPTGGVYGETGRELALALTTAFREMKKQDKLPTIEPEVFDSSILHFPGWWASFSSIVENEHYTDREKMCLLVKYTKGAAHEIARGFQSQLHNHHAYRDAKASIFETYGDKVKIAEAYKAKLASWPQIRDEDSAALRKYADFLDQCRTAIQSVGYLSSLEQPEENAKMASKLPDRLAYRWNRHVMERVYPDHTTVLDNAYGNHPTFEQFCVFVRREARIADGICSPKKKAQSSGNHDRPQNKPRAARSFSAQASAVGQAAGEQKKRPPQPPSAPRGNVQSHPAQNHPHGGRKYIPREQQQKECMFCKRGHHITSCDGFMSKPASERKDFAMQKDLCYGCLYFGHSYRYCRSKNQKWLKDEEVPVSTMNTEVKKTEERANENPPPTAAEEKDAVDLDRMVTSMNTELVTDEIKDHMSFVVPLTVFHPVTKRKSYVYALLDTQSDGCFMSWDLADRLGVPRVPCRIKLDTMVGDPHTVPSAQVNGLMVQGFTAAGRQRLAVPPCYCRPEIPANREQIPRHSDLRRWPHLQPVIEETIDRQDSWDIEMLIGYNMFCAFIPDKVLSDGLDKPYGLRTPLGWSIMGPKGNVELRRARALAGSAHVIKGDILEDIHRVFDAGFSPAANEDEKVSQDDLKFLQIMQSECLQEEDGHFTYPLPVKDRENPPPSSRDMALRRLWSLKKRFLRDPEFLSQYTRFMQNMFEKLYAEPVPRDRLAVKKVWYLPHQGVKHPRKPGKVRVVFDGSAISGGVSLNSMLYSGPDLNNSLLGVLCRFRVGKIAFTCDIESMFLQIRVAEQDRDYLRFFWYPGGDVSREPEEFRVAVHLFGAASSPAVATYALRQVAERYSAEYDEDVLNFIRYMFYVDDGLGSADTEEEVLKQINASHDLCARGGFNLHKYACCSVSVMEQIPEEIRAENVQQVEMNLEAEAQQVTLGMIWCLLEDCWRFKIQPQQKPMTRRGLLSTLSAIYDPMGVVSPVLLKGRNMLKGLCSAGYHWDSPLPEDVCEEWRAWYNQLSDLESLRIPRCYRESVQEVVTVQYHIFADASMDGYGACAYVLFRDGQGNVDTSLVLAKSRVHPSKPVSMPRMELQAAVMAVKLKNILIKELPYKTAEIFLWSDSQVVLGYLRNEAKRFHIYVANRVQYIKEHSSVRQWYYVNTKENPADLASRGVMAVELACCQLWWKGPECMKSPARPQVDETLRADDPEVRSEVRVLSTIARGAWSYLERIETLSSWRKMLICTALWQRFVAQAARVVKGQPKQEYPREVTVAELQSARTALVRSVQKERMPSVYEFLSRAEYPGSREAASSRRNELKGFSNLFRLDPYLDQEGVIRVGGRVRRSDLPNDLKHPCLLPTSTPVAAAVVRYHHELVCHAGINHTLSSLRCNGWWITRSRRLIGRLVRECVICNRVRGPFLQQRMSDLPRDRLIESPPFTYCGVDLLGPFEVRERRSVRKRWISLFTCLVSRAVHLEVCDTLSTDSFITAYRRFVCRRGPVRLLRSDQGTNIVGARNELTRLWEQQDAAVITRRLAELGCDYQSFQFNVPRAPHMGGVWERLVKAVKNTLRSLLLMHPRRLDDWALLTFVAEAELVVNSRPLTYIETGDGGQPAPLSPIRLLTQKEGPAPPPPGKFSEPDVYGRARWRQAQYMSDQFWSRWRAEYLPTLQHRKKWLEKKDNLAPGDVVMLQEDNADRCTWPMGRVVDVIRSADGLVRAANVKTRAGTYARPISRMVLLVPSDQGGRDCPQ